MYQQFEVPTWNNWQALLRLRLLFVLWNELLALLRLRLPSFLSRCLVLFGQASWAWSNLLGDLSLSIRIGLIPRIRPCCWDLGAVWASLRTCLVTAMASYGVHVHVHVCVCGVCVWLYSMEWGHCWTLYVCVMGLVMCYVLGFLSLSFALGILTYLASSQVRTHRERGDSTSI